MSLLETFGRYPLTFGPTPIEHLPRLTEALGGKVDIYAKRDDCNSGLAFGGNKHRMLEYIVPDAIESGADTLVSIGGVQSNHTRLVASTDIPATRALSMKWAISIMVGAHSEKMESGWPYESGLTVALHDPLDLRRRHEAPFA